MKTTDDDTDCTAVRRFRYAGHRCSLEHSSDADVGSVVRFSACATKNRRTVAWVDGHFARQRDYCRPIEFVNAMDALSQETYDAAEFVVSLGSRYWSGRAGILFFDEAFTKVPHRGRGLARELARAAVREFRKPRHPLLVVVQPWPIAFAAEGDENKEGLPVLTTSEWQREMSRVTLFWLDTFPWLNNVGCGGLNRNRWYHYGFAP